MAGRIAVLFVGLLALGVACARPTWARAGATEADLRRDDYECWRDARLLHSGATGILGGVAMGTEYRRCMEARGWSR